MKNLRLTWGLLAFAALLTFSGCQKDEATAPETELEFTGVEFQLENLDDLENTAITGATETSEFAVDHTAAHQSDRHPLAEILSKLNLNERQKRAIRGFVHDHAVCTKEHREKIQELHRLILQRANAIREEYIKAYKAGRITKAELERRLNVLRETVREEIHKHEGRQMHLRMLRQCRSELFTKIESVLNREQLQQWNRWKQSMHDARQR